MKKKTILAIAAVTGCFLISHQAMTYAGGAPSGRSGSPIASGGNSCASVGCHNNGPAVSTETVVLTSDIPVGGFEENTDYTFTIALNDGGATSTKVGFEASIESMTGHAGTISSSTTETQLIGSFVTHSNSGTSMSGGTKSYTFTWNSGTTQSGVALFAAVNFTNSSGNTLGDVVITESMMFPKVSGISLNENQVAKFEISPNPANEVAHLSNVDADVREVDVYSLNGKLIKTFSESSKTDDFNWELSLDYFDNGTYLVVPSGKSLKRAQKLMVSK